MTKRIYLSTLACLFFIAIYGQSKTSVVSKTKEIKINYSNGMEVFNIYISNPTIKYYDSIEYTWYNEYSKIKSTKGGSGGNLLHGNYKYFDKYGNLRLERNYLNGRLNGIEKYWDSLGNVTSLYKYKDGECYYQKFKNDENEWVEYIGPMFKKGTIRKIFSEYNSLIEIDTFYNGFDKSVSIYFYDGKTKKSYFQLSAFGFYNGRYIEYYESGKIKLKGQYWDSSFLSEIRVGQWISFDELGVKTVTKYERKLVYWENGEVKGEGSVFFDNEKNEWIRYGIWQFYSSDGKADYKGQYIDGIFYEINE